ncbi:MAG: cyclic nucleotide-binding domain-containing protein, partial [Planctomycetota bacterium]
MSISVQRPQRWDVPFGDQMRPVDVERLLTLKPFVDIDADKFSSNTSLHDILLNDARIVKFAPGDLIVREGDYGNSAFLILDGSVRVTLQSLTPAMLGRKTRTSSGWIKAISNLVRGTKYPEIRKYGEARLDNEDVGRRGDGNQTRVFLQDVPGVLDQFNTLRLGEGELFGEVSALSRNPRLASVFAEVETEAVEIRWQGLREIMRRDPALKKHVHDLYRE